MIIEFIRITWPGCKLTIRVDDRIIATVLRDWRPGKWLIRDAFEQKLICPTRRLAIGHARKILNDIVARQYAGLD